MQLQQPVRTWHKWMDILAILLFQRPLYMAARMEYVLRKKKRRQKQTNKHNNRDTERERKPSLTWKEWYHLGGGENHWAFESFLVCFLFSPQLGLILPDQSCSLRNLYSPPSSHPEGNATSQTNLPQSWLVIWNHREARVFTLKMLQLQGSKQ